MIFKSRFSVIAQRKSGINVRLGNKDIMTSRHILTFINQVMHLLKKLLVKEIALKSLEAKINIIIMTSRASKVFIRNLQLNATSNCNRGTLNEYA